MTREKGSDNSRGDRGTMTNPMDEVMLTRLSALLKDMVGLKLSEVRPPTKKKDADGEWIN